MGSQNSTIRVGSTQIKVKQADCAGNTIPDETRQYNKRLCNKNSVMSNIKTSLSEQQVVHIILADVFYGKEVLLSTSKQLHPRKYAAHK
jgi:hypothetical protein